MPKAIAMVHSLEVFAQNSVSRFSKKIQTHAIGMSVLFYFVEGGGGGGASFLFFFCVCVCVLSSSFFLSFFKNKHWNDWKIMKAKIYIHT